MVQKLKYTLIFTFIIIISSVSFAISKDTTVPIYLTVPEYLKITYVSKGQLNLKADNNFKDGLDFKVEANVDYYLDVKFTRDDGSHANQIIKSSHLSISNGENQWVSEEGSSQDTTIEIPTISGDPGSLTYFLTFWLEEKGWMYNASERKIGDIQITVSSN